MLLWRTGARFPGAGVVEEEQGEENRNRASALESVPTHEGAALEPLESPRRYLWRLKTTHLPILEPHGHTIETDSVTDEGHGATLLSPVVHIPEDMWVVRMSIRVNNAPRSTLHHSALWRLDEKHPICEFDPPMRQIILSAGDIAEGVEFPAPYAIFLKKGTPVVLQTMVHNPLLPLGPGGRYRDVYGEIALEIERPAESARSRPLEFFDLALEDSPCTDSTFIVPSATSSFIRKPWSSNPYDRSRYVFSKPGTVVIVGAHTHAWAGGRSVTVLRNNAPLVMIAPALSTTESWSWISPRLYPMLDIAVGDMLSIEAAYENVGSSALRGAMGMAGVYFAPADYGLENTR